MFQTSIQCLEATTTEKSSFICLAAHSIWFCQQQQQQKKKKKRWLSSGRMYFRGLSFTLSDFLWKGKNALLNESLKKEYFRNGVALKSAKIRAVEVETSVEFNSNGNVYLLFKMKIETIRWWNVHRAWFQWKHSNYDCFNVVISRHPLFGSLRL